MEEKEMRVVINEGDETYYKLAKGKEYSNNEFDNNRQELWKKVKEKGVDEKIHEGDIDA